MASKDPATRRLIEGLDLVPNETLPKEFSRFQKDDMYFIQHCHYSDFISGACKSFAELAAKVGSDIQTKIQNIRDNVNPAEAEEARLKKEREEELARVEEFVPRCLALTPAALFIADATNDSSVSLYRATKYENIKEVGYQVLLKKKLFGSEKRLYLCFKSETEPDCYVYLDAEQSKDFIRIFAKIMSVRRPTGFVLREIPESQAIKEYVNTDIPSGFLTAHEIQRLNANRQDINEHINGVLQEVNVLNKELETLRPEAATIRSQLNVLSGATTDDLTILRRKRQELHEAHVSLQRTAATMQTENYKLQQDLDRAHEQLTEDKNNYDKLVKESVSEADNAALKEQNNMALLRQKAQKRESDKLTEQLNVLSTALAAKPATYSGHPVFAAKAQALEAKIEENLKKWSQEMETANRLEKFIGTIACELERVDEQLDIQYNRKMELLAEIEKRLGVGAAAEEEKKKKLAAAAASQKKKNKGGDDDDLLDFGSDSGSSSNSVANESFGIDDDLGDKQEATAAKKKQEGVEVEGDDGGNNTNKKDRTSVVVDAPTDLDDDLLGGGGPTTAEAPSSAGAVAAPPSPPPATSGDVDLDDDI